MGGLTLLQKELTSRERKKEIEKKIPGKDARIDECKLLIKQVSGGINLEDAQSQVLECQQIFSEAKRCVDEFNTGENADEVEQLRELNRQLREATSDFEEEKNAQQRAYLISHQRLETIDNDIMDHNRTVQICDDNLCRLIGDYREQKNAVYTEHGNECHYCSKKIECPHCEEQDAEAEKIFNTKLSDKKKSVIEAGKSFRSQKNESEKTITELKKEKFELGNPEKPEILSLSENGKMVKIRIQIVRLNQDKPVIEIPKKLTDSAISTEKKLESAFESLSIIKSNTALEVRVSELKKQKKSLSDEFDKIEKFLSLLDKYNQQLAEATEEPVNAMFKYVSFRLFDTQINGTVVPVCDIMDKSGRPYETALSGGERIKAGLDIIKTLSRHYDLFTTVFIDNAESVTDMPVLGTQAVILKAAVLLKCTACEAINPEEATKCNKCDGDSGLEEVEELTQL